MARRYKMTGCARIFIVLIIIAPIAFFAASYINNADPMETVSTWFGGREVVKQQDKGILEPESSAADLEEQVRRLKKDVEYYKIEAQNYKRQLEECQNDSVQ